MEFQINPQAAIMCIEYLKNCGGYETGWQPPLFCSVDDESTRAGIFKTRFQKAETQQLCDKLLSNSGTVQAVSLIS